MEWVGNAIVGLICQNGGPSQKKKQPATACQVLGKNIPVLMDAYRFMIEMTLMTKLCSFLNI